MCNVDETGDKKPVPRVKSLSGAPCVKCGQPGVLITRIHDSFCKDCFQVYVVHKFRSAIGKSKLIRDGEKVLVAFSGGANSSALLHLITDGLSHRAHKRLRFTPTLIHIDESGLLGNDKGRCVDRLEQVKLKMQASSFPCYLTHLEQILKASQAEDTNYTVQLDRLEDNSGDSGVLLSQPSSEQTQELQSLVSGVGSATAREDVVRNLRTQLLVCAARQLGFSKILTAETSTRLAVRILSDVAQGRGSQVALDTGISDDRNTDVMFMRPVRDLTAKELAMYNNLFGVESIFIPELTTKTGLSSTIERLTQTFVCGLQADFPSTISNIVRTSEKLGLPDLKGTDKCAFCQSPLDTNVGKASALSAVLFSEKMSRTAAHAEPTETEKSLDKLKDTLCYGCRLSLKNFTGSESDLPQFISKVSRATIRAKQREQLSDFLLENEDTK